MSLIFSKVTLTLYCRIRFETPISCCSHPHKLRQCEINTLLRKSFTFTFTSVLVFVILTIINSLETFFLPNYRTHTLKICLKDRPGIVNQVKETLTQNDVKLVSLNASMPNKTSLKLSMIIRKPKNLGMDKVINLVNNLDEVDSMEIE